MCRSWHASAIIPSDSRCSHASNRAELIRRTARRSANTVVRRSWVQRRSVLLRRTCQTSEHPRAAAKRRLQLGCCRRLIVWLWPTKEVVLHDTSAQTACICNMEDRQAAAATNVMSASPGSVPLTVPDERWRWRWHAGDSEGTAGRSWQAVSRCRGQRTDPSG